jgi:multiple antibiotic resistance protein
VGTLFLKAFITMFVIIDPIGNVPVFLILTRDGGRRAWLAFQGVLAAGLLVLGFGLFGQGLLRYLGISIPSLQVAGGLLLILLALEELRGEFTVKEANANVAMVPLATPIMAGPGAISAIMVFFLQEPSTSARSVIVAALVLVLILTWLALWLSEVVRRLLRDTGIEFLTRVMGLLLAAIAVEFIAEGIRGLVAAP